MNRDTLLGEYITNTENEKKATSSTLEQKELPAYAWRNKDVGGFFRITKDFFRCKGCPSHPKIARDKTFVQDCVGGENHGLPIRDGKEFIYPTLINLLNYVQEKTQKKVVITTGFRCPQHNTYADASAVNKTSKHMLGAEVDFYVEGIQKESEKIVAILQHYYKKHFGADKEYYPFQRLEGDKYHVSIAPWANKEVLIKLNLESENRDFDNSHPYSYITLQVRYDRDTDKKIVFDEKQINQFLRK